MRYRQTEARQTEGSQGMKGICVCREKKGKTHKTSATQKSCLMNLFWAAEARKVEKQCN